MKLRGLLPGHVLVALGHFFLFFQRLCCTFIIMINSLWRFVCWCKNGECPFGGFTLKLRHRGRSSKARDQSLLPLSLLLSFSHSLFILSSLSLPISLSRSLSCRSSSSLIGAVQSADSPFMADGGREGGAGWVGGWVGGWMGWRGGFGAVGMLARSNQGNSSSLQHFCNTTQRFG